jgi:hypothetical protein
MKNELNAPAGVSATAAGPGINRIEFSTSGENDVAYEVWRRHGDTVDWYLHATIDTSAFEDSAVTAGQYYEYKVRATRSGEVSEFSASAVVYGK